MSNLHKDVNHIGPNSVDADYWCLGSLNLKEQVRFAFSIVVCIVIISLVCNCMIAVYFYVHSSSNL